MLTVATQSMEPRLLSAAGFCGLVTQLSDSFATPWTVACQAPLSMGFSRQEYWNGLPFPSPGIFLTQGMNLCLLHCRRILNGLSHLGGPYHRIPLPQFWSPCPTDLLPPNSPLVEDGCRVHLLLATKKPV